MKLIIFSDVDGTVYPTYPKKQTIHKNNYEQIALAQEKGLEFIICTGNGFFNEMKNLANELKARYVITSNGAAIYDMESKEFIYKSTIPADKANKMLAKANEIGCATNFWDTEWVYANEYAKEFTKEVLQNVMLGTENEVAVKTEITNDIFKIEFYDDKEKVDQMEELIEGQGFELARMAETHLEVTHAGVSKGHAVKIISEMKGWDIENTMAIGDSANDVSMFKVANYTYAMANGSDWAKSHVKYHTSSVEQGGLGEAIADFMYRNKVK